MKVLSMNGEAVTTVHGNVDPAELARLREGYDMRALLRTIDELPEVFGYAGGPHGLRDLLSRLYCVAATLLRGSTAVVPPQDGELQVLLAEIQSDLDEAVAFFQSCRGVIEPLERLPSRAGQSL